MQTPDDLFPIVYDELRRLAGHLRGPRLGDHATSLVHEAYLRLADQPVVAESPLHFRRIAARAMRFVLVDRARERGSAKRGGDWQRVTLEGLGDGHSDIIDLVDALERLKQADEVAFDVVELRFFGGFSVPETAETLGVAPRTVDRAWRRAKAFLGAALS
ncbi:MAG: ECF-type sigma factor [Myxococcota bacterium]